MITKNPTSALWLHLNGPSTPIRRYTLDELADYVDLSAYRQPSQRSQERYSLGRNCALFDWLRNWAYKAIRDHRGTELLNNYVVWQAQCYSKALERNGEFSYPLDPKEVSHIAKSVARYCWKHDPDAEVAFRARQAEKRRKGGLVGAGGRPRTTTANGKPWEEAGVSRKSDNSACRAAFVVCCLG